MSTWPLSLERLRDTVGLWTSTHETLPAAQCGEIAAEIEGLGFAAMWIPEAWGRESFTSAGLLLSATSQLTIATGITSIWGRDAVSSVNAAKTLNAAYADRFVLGLGISHQPLVERLRGHEYASPFSTMKDYLAAMDAAPMFAPEGQHAYGRVLAALGPRMLALGASDANGVLTYLVTPEHTSLTRGIVGDQFIGVEQAVVLGDDREEFLRRAHGYLEIYTGLENYRNSWRRLGFSDPDFVRGGSERLCDAMVVHGHDDAVLAAVREHRDAGANHVCIQVLGSDLTTPPLHEWRLLGAALN